MPKTMILAAAIVAGAAVLAHSDQWSFQKNRIWKSEQGFSELVGYKNAFILNTSPKMILAKKQGQAMVCPMPTGPGEPWPPCWAMTD